MMACCRFTVNVEGGCGRNAAHGSFGACVDSRKHNLWSFLSVYSPHFLWVNTGS